MSRALKVLGLTNDRSVATAGTDDVRGLKASEISELRSTAKWREPLEEINEEDEFLTREELKLFQSVAARFSFLAMDTPKKMASPRAEDLVALKKSSPSYNQVSMNGLQIPMDSIGQQF